MLFVDRKWLQPKQLSIGLFSGTATFGLCIAVHTSGIFSAAFCKLIGTALLLPVIPSETEQTKLVDCPLQLIADMSYWGHIRRLPEETSARIVLNMLSVSQEEVTLQQVGSVHQVVRGKTASNRSSLFRTLTSM